jgi:hypothetical protein
MKQLSSNQKTRRGSKLAVPRLARVQFCLGDGHHNSSSRKSRCHRARLGADFPLPSSGRPRREN